MRLGSAVLAIGIVACSQGLLPPPGHVLLYFDTDAPVPTSFGDPAADVEPLFDRLDVAVFAPGETKPCDGCERELVVDRGLLTARLASIQIPTSPGTAGYRVRARLFLARHVTIGGTPPESGTVEVVAALPPAPPEGSTDQTLFLSTEDVGAPRGTLAAPVTLITGAPQVSKVGTWPGAARRGCSAERRPGETCLPGGAFWMGRPGERASRAENTADRPRLVVVAPYTLDENEVTVADIRAFEKNEIGVDAWNGTTDGDSRSDFCTFTAQPAERDAFPVNCLTWTAARHYCLSTGKELPTEAQFEYAAGALSSRRFPWGSDPPRCEDAVWGRGGPGIFAQIVAPCRADVTGPECIGPSCGTARARDVVALEAGTLRDLAGNVSEWMLDRYNTQAEACWTAPGPRRDPVCTLAGSGGLQLAIRGGSWLSSGTTLAASSRDFQDLTTVQPFTGFRCARNTESECGPIRPGLFRGTTTGGERGSIVTLGVGCSGVVSVFAAHADQTAFLLVGTVSASGQVRFEGADLAKAAITHTFEGEVVDADHLEGTWRSSNGKTGTWNVFRQE